MSSTCLFCPSVCVYGVYLYPVRHLTICDSLNQSQSISLSFSLCPSPRLSSPLPPLWCSHKHQQVCDLSTFLIRVVTPELRFTSPLILSSISFPLAVFTMLLISGSFLNPLLFINLGTDFAYAVSSPFTGFRYC